jgi:hypothetical protein
VAKRKNGEDTDVTLVDVVRELRTISGKLDKLDTTVSSMDKKLEAGLRRDATFEARISKLETDMAKLKRKRL